jgi:hemoglobin/transferrin/lactoferrin receptor protein
MGFDYVSGTEWRLGLNVAHVNELTIDTLHQDYDLGWVPELYSLTKPSYTTVDFFAEWQASENLVFNLAVTNLLDKLYRDHSSVGDYSEVAGYELVVGPWEAGRDIRLSASYSF